ncbi:hypothetical protein VTK73DRAFT_2549 [Phialemonium thermophilum]|uniref:Uncharacterized protein n=1 Tax=Phialemonium thermophilum TaxID=223376 RepID=A0ABR3VS06_9PEZI
MATVKCECVIQKVNATGSAHQEMQEVKGLLDFKKDDAVLVVYDAKIPVAQGGLGTGGVISTANDPAMAGGGIGKGAEVDMNGVWRGGNGVGGDVHGNSFAGRAGDGQGGLASGSSQGAAAEAGQGVGGEVIREPLAALAQGGNSERAAASQPSASHRYLLSCVGQDGDFVGAVVYQEAAVLKVVPKELAGAAPARPNKNGRIRGA